MYHADRPVTAIRISSSSVRREKKRNKIASRLFTYTRRRMQRLSAKRSCKLARKDGAETLAEAETRHLGARHLVNSRRIVSRVSRIVWHSSLARYAENVRTGKRRRYKRKRNPEARYQIEFYLSRRASGDSFHVLYGGFLGNVGMALLGAETSHRVWSNLILLVSFLFFFLFNHFSAIQRCSDSYID